MSRRLIFAGIGALAALAPALWMRGFTVDDALISIRYAHHIVHGLGHRWNEGGAPTDGVTPLLWPYLIAPFARGAALETLAMLRVIGTGLWCATGALIGLRAFDVGGARRAGIALALMAMVFPLGAWAASGMETPLVTFLATMAVLAKRPRWAAWVAGLAAAFRPEMTPWAVVIGIGVYAQANANADAPTRSVTLALALLRGLALAVLPIACVSIVRLVVFGSAAPLSVAAKPSDLSHGFTYAGAGAVVMHLPIVAPLRRLPTIAFAVHLLAVAFAGGDWMPYARLMVPVAPSLVIAIASAETSERSVVRVITLVRWLAAFGMGIRLLVFVSPHGRNVLADRTALIEAARPVLASSKSIASLDIGWVSAAYDGPIVDLAGLTDPSIAALAGGHTSKHVDPTMLLERDVDTVIFWGNVRVVEERLYDAPLFRQRFVPAEDLPLRYKVFRSRKPPTTSSALPL